MRVLVTGGAGFIGSNLVHTLIGAGHETGVVDDLSAGKLGNLHPAAWFRRLDILDLSFAEAVAEFAPQAVVHLAAQASVSASLSDPVRNDAVNVDGTRHVARVARGVGAARVVSASSAAIYGEPEVVPLPETAHKAPANPYGVSKLAAEGALAVELRGSGTDFASFRFSNVYGPRQDALGEGGVVAVFAERMTGGGTPAIFGSGGQTRDFIYVGDVVNAILSALHAEAPLAGEGVDGPAYNISTGSQTSVEELATRMRGVARFTGAIERRPARVGDVERSALDPAKALGVFGFEARTALDDGLRMTLAWFQSAR